MENIQKVTQIYQKCERDGAIQKYAMRDDKADIAEKERIYKLLK